MLLDKATAIADAASRELHFDTDNPATSANARRPVVANEDFVGLIAVDNVAGLIAVSASGLNAVYMNGA